jgi:hypothetical protein
MSGEVPLVADGDAAMMFGPAETTEATIHVINGTPRPVLTKPVRGLLEHVAVRDRWPNL